MKINEYIKDKLIYFAISLFLIAIISIGSSYAFQSSDINKVITNDLVISYDQVSQSSINITKQITIENIGTERKQFTVYANRKDSNSSLEANKIHYSINKGYDSLLSELNNNVIYKGYLNKNESIKLDVNLWIDYDTLNNSDQGKSILIDFDVK